MAFIAQDALDYSDQAQVRTASDTKLLRKRATLTLSDSVQEYALPGDVIQLLAVYWGSEIIDPLNADDALSLLSGADAISELHHYTLEPGVIGFIPTPTVEMDITLFYVARPALLDSDDEFELQGEAEALIEHLMLSYLLDDGSQPELAAAELQLYQQESARLKGYKLHEAPTRLATATRLRLS